MSHTNVYHRREKILRFLEEQGSADIKFLAQQFGVSSWTIRRDLIVLEEQHSIQRSYGRVEVELNDPNMRNFEINSEQQIPAKERIGKKAAQLIKSGQFVALAAGTTTTQVALALKGRSDISIMTNALNIAQELSRESGIRLICAGGEVHGDYYTLTGPVTERILNTHYYDVAIIGVSGLSLSKGVTVNSQSNAVVIEIMRQNAAKSIIVADHSKFDYVSYALLTNLADVDVIVTDRMPSIEYQTFFRTSKTTLIIA